MRLGLALLLRGFSLREARRLAALRQRADRGAFREVTADEARLRFGRWLAERGRVGEGGDAPPPRTGRGAGAPELPPPASVSCRVSARRPAPAPVDRDGPPAGAADGLPPDLT
jgi:hypothetical protein